MKKLQPKPEKDPRGSELFRVKTEPKDLPLMERNYQPYEGSPFSTIPELAEALEGHYDVLVLHDLQDECKVLFIKEGQEPEVGSLGCQTHHPTERKQNVVK